MSAKRSDETNMPENQQAVVRPSIEPVPRRARLSGVYQKGPAPDGGWGFVLPRPDGTFDVAVAKSGAVLGSGPKADIRIAGPGVGQEHARIEVRGDGVYVQDLGTPGGTYVSGVRAARVGVVHGDVVRFGQVLLIFVGHDLISYKGRVELGSPLVASPADASAFLDPALSYAREGRSFFIDGGPGIGKRTLAQVVAKKRAGRVVTIDAADFGPDSPVRLPASGAGTYVVVHADRLPRSAQIEIAHAAGGSSAIVIATLSVPFNAAASEGAIAPAFGALLGGRGVLIPPLDARREDILGIIWALARKIGIDSERITVELIERLARAGWPGGIAEIEAALREAAAATQGPLDSDSIHSDLSRPPSAAPSSPADDDPALARERLADALDKSHGSIAATARHLGLSRQAIYREADRLGLGVGKRRNGSKA